MNKKFLLPIVIVAILVVVIGIYFTTRGPKGPEEKPIGEEPTVTSEEPTEKEMAESWEEEFNLLKEVSPIDDFSRQMNSEFKAVLGKVFGGVKLEMFLKEEAKYMLMYRIKRELRENDVEALIISFRERGYTETQHLIEGTTFVLNLEKEEMEISIHKVGEQITVGILK
jgi:NifB/MoaA-like Fe-S oxidoreductase